MEEIKWTYKTRNEEVLRRVKEKQNILKAIRKRKASWLGQILRRDCLQKPVIEGKIIGMRGGGRRRFGMLTDLMRGRTYARMKEDTQDRNTWRAQFHC